LQAPLKKKRKRGKQVARNSITEGKKPIPRKAEGLAGPKKELGLEEKEERFDTNECKGNGGNGRQKKN